MAKVKFKLKAIRSVTVRALNGKTYSLKSGSNQLELDYDDYAALLKALGLKPADKQTDKDTLPPKAEVQTPEVKSAEVPAYVDEPQPETTSPVDEPQHETTSPVDEQQPEDNTLDDTTGTDYNSMSYTKLKAEYKRITGKNCRLKKEEVIQFLQEQENA